MQYFGYVLLPCAAQGGFPPHTQHVTFHRTRGADKQWRTWLQACRADGQELGEVKLRDAAADDLLQAVGKVAHQQRLHTEPEVLHAAPAAAVPSTTDGLHQGLAAAAAAAAAPPAVSTDNNGNSSQLPFVRLYLAVPDALLQHYCSWRRSADAAALFKQLFTCDTNLGVAVQQVMLPRLGLQQQQQVDGNSKPSSSSSSAAFSTGRYTLLSCFRELPSVSTAPPPMTISIQQQQKPQQQQQQQQGQQQDAITSGESTEGAAPAAPTAAPAPVAAPSNTTITSNTNTSSSSSSTSLADVPPEVMAQLLSLLTARDLSALALTCRGLRAVSWEAVPGLRLTLYPHQRHALSWMLHREVTGGQQLAHPFVVQYCTTTGAAGRRGGGGAGGAAPAAAAGGGAGAGAGGGGDTAAAAAEGGWPLWLNQVTGDLSTDPPEPLSDIRGGFFCDEPGLGKTVTALSLILKTQGTVPTAPPGASITWLKSPDGRRLGYYTSPDPAAAAAADLNPDASDLLHPLNPGPGGSLSRRNSSSGLRRRRSSSYGALAGGGVTRSSNSRGAAGRRPGSSDSSRQNSAWQLAPSLRGGSSTRREQSAPAAAAAVGDSDSAAAAPAVSSLPLEDASQPQQQQEQLVRVTRQSAVAGAAGAAGASDSGVAAYAVGSPPEQSAAKRQKLADGAHAPQQQQQQQQQDQSGTDTQQQQEEGRQAIPGGGGGGQENVAAPPAPPAPPAAAAAHGRLEVQCDHCSKWRRLPHGYQLLDSDPDLPWYCCLHPEPHLASCLVPEEPHDMMPGQTALDPSLAAVSYDHCVGYLPAHNMTAAAAGGDEAAAEAEARHCENVSHFVAVVNAAASRADSEGALRVLAWLAKQSPDALLSGVTVPRELRAAAPDYGRLFSMMALQPAAVAAATAAAATPAARNPNGTAAKGSSSKKKPPPKSNESSNKKKRGRWNSSSSSDEDYEVSEDATDSNDADDNYSSCSKARRQKSATPGPSSSSKQQQQPAAAAAAAASKGAAGGSSGGAGGGKPRARRVSAAAAAAHSWVQPASLHWLRFDVQALREALDKGAGSAPRMFLSSATLVIVPVTLIPHWQQQIRQHLMPRRLRVLVLGSATAVAGGQDPTAAAAAGGGGSSGSGRGVGGSSSSGRSLKASSTAAGGGGAAESVCPPAHELAWGYDVVITTFHRLSADWAKRGDPNLADRLVLLKVHWLRILVDEGHSLGASLSLTNKLSMSVQLAAQRRWVMTGTPTPTTSTGSGAANLQPLLAFLHQQPFGSSTAAWSGAVAKPLEAAADTIKAAAVAAAADGAAPGSSSSSTVTTGVIVAEWGRRQLMALLSRVMIRSCKADLALLPPCYKKVTLLDFAPAHASSYNALVEVIRRNLLLADWCDDTHTESMLSKQQSQWAKEMLSNIRLACCVAGGMNVVVKEEDLLECLQLLAGKLELPQPSKEQHVVLINTPHATQEQQQQAEQQQEQVAAAPANMPPAAAADSTGGDGTTTLAAAAAVATGSSAVDGADTHAAVPDADAAGPSSSAGDGAAPAPAAAAGVSSSIVVSGCVLRRRWYYTGPGHPLHEVEEALREGCVCQVCKEWSPFPLVTPCGHLQCTDCCAVSRTGCRVCGGAFEMQPVEDPARYVHNPQPKWEVPLELIEWQPVYHQAGATGVSGGQWSANWQVTRSTKVLHLMQRLMEIGVYSPNRTHPAATATAAAAAAAAGFACTGPAAAATAAAAAASASAGTQAGSSSLVTKSCLKGGSDATPHQQQQQQQRPAAAGSSSSSVVKAIVFSQFWMHVQLIVVELSARGVAHFVLKSDMPAHDKQAAVMAFRASPHSCCLVMDASGALGLDLSFVRYIFLMEPLADASLEQQVVSRAHRMGAVAPVHVELFAMRHTAEEHMVELRYETASGRLSGTAADAAASSAAAAVAAGNAAAPAAGAAADGADAGSLTAGQQPQQQQQQDGKGAAAADGLGGAVASAKATNITNITDFVSVGAGENQINNRAMRNLLLLHLRKVNVAELPQLPVYEGPASLPNEAQVGGGGPAAACGAGRGLWSDVALQRQPRQQQLDEEGGPQEMEEQGEGSSGQQVARAASAEAEQPQQEQADASVVVEKPARKRIRFADDV